MTNLPLSVRHQLEERYSLARLPVLQELASRDGARKWLFSLSRLAHDDVSPAIETVFIPDGKRATVCLSSQVGCPLQCRFCRTGTQHWERNLTPCEILAQVLSVKDSLKDWPKDGERRQLTNVVMMGMGEPLLNYEAVKEALVILTDQRGLAFSRHRITVSTSGIVPMLAPLAQDCGTLLAVSLHAPSDDLRSQLMPINNTYSLKELMEAIRAYPAMSKTRKVTIEYVLLGGVNDGPAEARALLTLLRNLPVKVNLLTFNAWQGAPFVPSSAKTRALFAQILTRGGIDCFRRRARGQDILAACGQLCARKK
jgi:23S rRNA (adenine2503-C2)-methyltransferase